MKLFKKILIEMIPVILGVLIALFISDWKKQLDDKKFLEKIFSSVEKEMVLNLAEFSEALPKQYALIDSLNHYKSYSDVSLIEVLRKTSGLQIPTVQNTAWNSFLNSKLELIDFEVVSMLTEVEERKEFLKIKSEKLMDFLLSNTNSNESTAKDVLIIHLLNLIDTEEGMVETYNGYLAWHKKESNP